MDTTIKVDSTVRDRLAVMARERGKTIPEVVAELAGVTLTPVDREEQAARAHEYIKTHLCPDLTDEDVKAGERFWRELRAGRVPASLADLYAEQDSAA